jgi:hypothetical protein
MSTTVLAGIVIPGEQEGVGHLATEPSRHLNEPNQADHQGEWDFRAFRSESPPVIHLQKFGLPVQNKTHRPSDRYDRQWFIGSV